MTVDGLPCQTTTLTTNRGSITATICTGEYSSAAIKFAAPVDDRQTLYTDQVAVIEKVITLLVETIAE